MQNRKAMILVFAGPNGSGKSTITSFFEKVGKYTNADDIVAVTGMDNMIIRIALMLGSAVFIAVEIFFYLPADIVPLAGEGAMQAIAENSNIAFFNRAICQMENKKYEAAQQELDTIVSKNPCISRYFFVPLHYEKGRNYRASKGASIVRNTSIVLNSSQLIQITSQHKFKSANNSNNEKWSSSALYFSIKDRVPACDPSRTPSEQRSCHL